MKILESIGYETQIQDAIEGASLSQKEAVKEKIQFVKDNITKLETVNGKKVFYPIVFENDIYYHLQKAPDWLIEDITSCKKRKYYYPIQYATLTFR